jgi:hypothetical protein
VAIEDLKADTTYYYQIPAANGTTASEVLSFTTARAAGDPSPFSVAVLNDMGYTNARGTFREISKAVDAGEVAFAWHGGDISYADDWYSGILPCADDWPVCYNGTSTELPGTGPVPPEYKVPLPKGEVPNQGGPQGGDMSVLYESNWDLWQQWTNNLTTRVPYMVLPGNHEAACAEFDGPGNVLTAYLNDDKSNATAAKSNLTYYSCPPSQRWANLLDATLCLPLPIPTDFSQELHGIPASIPNAGPGNGRRGQLLVLVRLRPRALRRYRW